MTGRTPPAALIVSHGQPSDPDEGEREIVALARSVARHLPGWQVRGATLSGQGTLDAASKAAPDALVYPMFMTDGWFTRTNLPRRLAGHSGRLLPPFGTDPALAPLAARWLRAESPDAPRQVVVTAHGSGRSPYAALDTAIFVDALRRLLPGTRLRCGFVEQAPRLVEALRGAGPDALCLPFFATRRGHVLGDLPDAVAAAGFRGRVLDPIGLHPDVPALIAGALASVFQGVSE